MLFFHLTHIVPTFPQECQVWRPGQWAGNPLGETASGTFIDVMICNEPKQWEFLHSNIMVTGFSFHFGAGRKDVKPISQTFSLSKELSLLSNDLLASRILTIRQIGLNAFCQPKSLWQFQVLQLLQLLFASPSGARVYHRVCVFPLTRVQGQILAAGKGCILQCYWPWTDFFHPRGSCIPVKWWSFYSYRVFGKGIGREIESKE